MSDCPELDEAVLRLASIMVDHAKASNQTGMWLDSSPRILTTEGEVWGGRIFVTIEIQPEGSVPKERSRKKKKEG